ncbi:hypothetical protein Ocin01_16850 [Orchesella cincta]|uniref:Ricin B lectin domain-containing protein n=1 Tax=Orchesella cincta TaxID=48709 RepID=A0A1D2MA88_ORCCI|nr:hypothetical protein Ocin01_16850 [Orchesella cincta]
MEKGPVLFSLVVILSLLFSFGTSLDSGRFYFLRNVAENSYLQVKSGGKICENIGIVGTTSTLNSSSIAYRWRYIEFWGNKKMLNVEVDLRGLQFNELSVVPMPSDCELSFRNINVLPVNGSLYNIQNVADEKCFASNGVGSRISWTTCNQNNSSQQWDFIKISA